MIQQLYQIPIYIAHDTLPRKKLEQLEKDTIRLGDEISDYPDRFNPDIYKFSHKATDYYAHALPEFRDITNEVLTHVSVMLDEMGYSEEQIAKLTIINSWFGIYKTGDYLPMHTHRNSMLSCAFYIKSTTPTKLKFIHDIYRNTPFPTDINNQWSKNFTAFTCKPGQLTIFPSDAAHGCDKLIGEPDEIVKIMLSYNLGINK
ncbi:MAG: hypothetical protein HN730_00305 [Bdellovibrionales bacterium]|jgi:uncharacterized protein (TIGR02466 family)|nr:hypothetical protein [Bdellovibrionales bacterium]